MPGAAVGDKRLKNGRWFSVGNKEGWRGNGDGSKAEIVDDEKALKAGIISEVSALKAEMVGERLALEAGMMGEEMTVKAKNIGEG